MEIKDIALNSLYVAIGVAAGVSIVDYLIYSDPVVTISSGKRRAKPKRRRRRQ